MLGIVIVNYQTEQATVEYVRHLLPLVRAPRKVAIVNNGATPCGDRALADPLQAELLQPGQAPANPQSEVFVLSARENLGYARGNNLGAEFLLAAFPEIEHLLISNNDIEVSDGRVVDALLEKLRVEPAIGAIGPRVVGVDGRDQSPHRAMSLWTHLVWPTLFYPIAAPFLHGGLGHEVQTGATEGEHFRVMGCFWIVRAEAFRRVGGFDANTFLYGEEAIFSERIKRAGYCTYYLPGVAVVHRHGQTIDTHLGSRSLHGFARESLLYYYRTYRGAGFLSCAVAKAGFWLYDHCYDPLLRVLRGLRRRATKGPGRARP